MSTLGTSYGMDMERKSDLCYLKLNAKKSCLFKINKNYKDLVNNLGYDAINWSANLKYLGV